MERVKARLRIPGERRTDLTSPINDPGDGKSTTASRIVMEADNADSAHTRPGENKPYDDSLRDFLASLDPEAKSAFLSHAESAASPNELLQRAEQLDKAHDVSSKSRKFAMRVQRILASTQIFLRSAAICIQHNPEVGSLVLGGVNFVLELAIRWSQYFDRIAHSLERIRAHLGYLSEYAVKIFPEAPAVREALKCAYIDLIAYTIEVRKLYVDDKGRPKRHISAFAFIKQLYEPFEARFGSLEERFLQHVEITRHIAQAEHWKADLAERDAAASQRNHETLRGVLEWLSVEDFHFVQDENFRKRHGASGEWLLYSQQYMDWHAGDENSLLWCYGPPGAGKTILSSVVQEDVKARLENVPEIAYAFVYFTFREQKPPEFYIANIIKQLFGRIGQAALDLEAFRTLDEQYFRIGRRPGFRVLCGILRTLLQRFHQTHLLFDGLDECEQRKDLLELFRDLTSQPRYHKALHPVKIFITSRKEVDIERILKHSPVVMIKARHVMADIENFVKSETRKRIREGRLQIQDAIIEAEIVNTLVRKAGGMFLWVSLQLDSICDETTNDRDIRDVLRMLPMGLYETYQRVLLKIKASGMRRCELAIKVLRWVAFARSFLTIDELYEAVSVCPDVKKWCDIRFPSSKDLLLQVCCNLVSVENHYVRFTHYSVREFLQSEYVLAPDSGLAEFYLNPDEGTAELGKACLGYIMIEDISAKRRSPLTRRASTIQPFKLLPYAVNHWSAHLRGYPELNPSIRSILQGLFEEDCGVFLQNDILEFLLRLQNRRWVFDSWSSLGVHLTKPEQPLPVKYKLHYAVQLGLPSLVEHICDTDSSSLFVKDLCERSPLLGAMQRGDVEVVRVLLQKDITKQLVNAADDRGYTALHWSVNAAFPGWSPDTRILRLLLHFGADPNLTNNFGETPLHLTTLLPNSASILQLLLGKGADPNIRDWMGHTPLHTLLDSPRGLDVDCDVALRALIRSGAEMNIADKYERSLLQVILAESAFSGLLVPVLLDAGCDPHVLDDQGRTLLHLVVNNKQMFEWEKGEVIKLLVEGYELDLRAEDDEGRNVWDLAEGNAALMEVLEKLAQELVEEEEPCIEDGAGSVTPFIRMTNDVLGEKDKRRPEEASEDDDQRTLVDVETDMRDMKIGVE